MDAGVGQESTRPRILVCDDAPTMRAVIGHLLGGTCDVLAVASGEEALSAASWFEPDLIVSDVLMEGMDGHELCRRIRQDPALALVPVILLTSKADEESRAEGLELGADDYLVKPLRPRELTARVTSLLRLRRANLALAERGRELELANRTLREAQAALVQAEKLATVGTMVAGIAHEINNPLSFMKAGAAAIRTLAGDAERAAAGPLAAYPGARTRFDEALREIREVADEVTAGTLRLQDIVASLRSFTAGRDEEVEDLDLGDAIDRAWAEATAKVPGPAILEKTLGPLPPVRTVPHLLHRVLVHVLTNALQAGAGRGPVVLVAGRGSDEAVITVRDAGPGIPAEHLGRIFDPFFTTKKPGQGVGLGLTVSYGILRSLGGRIAAASPPGEGATFTVALPLGPDLPGAKAYNELRASAEGPGPGSCSA